MAALTITRGDSETINLIVTDGAGEPLDLTGKTLTFTAKRSLADDQADAIIAKTTGAGITHQAQTGDTVGLADVTIDPADTADLPAYSVALYYDLQYDDATTTKTTESGTLTVTPDVTTD